MELTEIVDRVAEIRSKGPVRFGRERIAEAAESISKAGDQQLRVELANESLAALTVALYAVDADQQPANIDRRTWRIVMAVPWGDAGWKRWGLRNWEARVLNRILRIRHERYRHVALFDYNEEGRTWHVNRRDYPTVESAIAYLKQNPVTLAEWRPHAEKIGEATRARMQRRRG